MNKSMWKFQQFTPPKARGNMKHVDVESWVAEEKYDGDRRIAQFCSDAVRFTGTRVSVADGLLVEKTANLPHLAKPVSALEGTVLDGEIVSEAMGARSKDVASIMGSAPEVAIVKQVERGWLTYAVFDCLFYRNMDIRHCRLEERRKTLKKVIYEWRHEEPARTHVFMVDQTPAMHAEMLFRDIIHQGGEGLIYKDPASMYGNQLAWVKRKREATYDVVIMGYKPGKGKYKGQVGAIKFGQYKNGLLIPCGQCSGMTDETRAFISKKAEKYLGTVIEIRANAREVSGKFRHPQFVRERLDKNPKECRYNAGEQ